MLKPIFLILTAASFSIPFSTYAAQSNIKTNNPQQFASQMNHRFARHHSHQGRHHSRGDKINKILQQLDLTSEQSQQIEVIKQEFETQNTSLKQDIDSNNLPLRLSLFTSDVSTEELREQHKKAQALHQQLGDNRFEMMVQVREVLTPEQQNKMAELLKQKRERRGKRRG